MSAKPSFFAELQRRNVYKVGAAYCVAGWLVVQVVTQVFPIYDLSASLQRIIVTAIMAGFPVALVLAWIFDVTPQGIVRTETLDASGESPAARGNRRSADRKLNVLLAALLVCALAYLGAERAGLVSRPSASANLAANDRSIAVLPFANLSADPANAFFAVGIQDEILTRLAKVGALKVISRTSTAHFASSPDDLPAIAKRLGVSAILEGSVQKAGELVHINVQLIRAASDEHLWAESYNRKLDDIFGVEGEVAQSIAEALSATLTGAEKQQLAQKPTLNPQAYEAYLSALVYEGRFTQTEPELKDWADSYAQAVRLDPGFALAWAGLARAQTEWYYDIDTTPQRLALAKSALDQAQHLAPDSAETFEALGLYRYWGLNDYDGALAAYAEALKRKPSAVGVLYSMGIVRRRQGHWEEALALQQRAAALDPLNSLFDFNLTLTLRALRRFDEAQAVVAKGLAANPNDFSLLGERIYTEQARGDLRAAHRFAEQLPLDGLDVFNLTHRFEQWWMERDYARAIAEIGQVLEHREQFDPGSQAFLLHELGTSERFAGKTAESQTHLLEARGIIEAQRASGDTNLYSAIGLIMICTEAGDHEAAERYARIAEEGLAKDAMGLPQAFVAHALAKLLAGDRAGAITLLEKAQAAPMVWGAFPAILRNGPQFDALRGDPRFDKLTQDAVANAAAPTP